MGDPPYIALEQVGGPIIHNGLIYELYPCSSHHDCEIVHIAVVFNYRVIFAVAKQTNNITSETVSMKI